MQKSRLSTTSSSTNQNVRVSKSATKKSPSDQKSVLYRPSSNTSKKKKEWDVSKNNCVMLIFSYHDLLTQEHDIQFECLQII